MPKVRHDTRKIISIGKSKALTLPWDWIRVHGLKKKGGEITVLYNDIVLILPPDFPTDKRHAIEKKILEMESEMESNKGGVERSG